MKQHESPIGFENNTSLLQESSKSDLVVAAWGNHGIHNGRDKEVICLLSNIEMKCFKITAKKQPAHPLYQPGNIELKEYRV
jgi:hypothetical protein